MSCERKNMDVHENIIETEVKRLPKPVTFGETDPDKPFALLPNSTGKWDLVGLGNYAIEKRSANETLSDIDSFIAYVYKFKTSSTELFASINENTIVATFDYLRAPRGIDVDADKLLPGRCEHKCILKISLSERFNAWSGIARNRIGQFDFAEFLDEYFIDVVKPDGATFREIALQLEGTVRSEFKSSRRIKDGSGAHTWNVDVKLEGGNVERLEVPDSMSIMIPIFEGGDPVELSARVRVRLDDGKAFFYILPDSWKDIIRGSFSDVIKKVSKEIVLPVYIRA